MSFLDRDYNQTGQSPHSSTNPVVRFFMRLPWATRWLLISNVSIWILDNILNGWFKLGKPMQMAGEFAVDSAINSFQIWRFVTAMFLHTDAMHVLFNMVTLYFCGPFVEAFFGTRKFLVFYFLCGLSSFFFFLVAVPLMPSLSNATPIIGASGAIYGILIAFAMRVPDMEVRLFMVLPIKASYLALGLVGLAGINAFVGLFTANVDNAGGDAAHLGGAALGFVLMKFPGALQAISKLFGAGNTASTMPEMAGTTMGGSSFYKPDPKNLQYTPTYTPPQEAKIKPAKPDRQEKAEIKRKRLQEEKLKKVDAILDKVRDQGLASLTSKEKKILQEETDRLNKNK